MSRKARIDIEGYWYHIIGRGVNKEKIFYDDEDKNFFLSILANICKRLDILISAYCLMPNHFHLLVFRGADSLYKLMHPLLTKYSIYFNKKYNRTGHLFQDRYKSFIVLNENYLLKLIAYIHKNPVRAKLVSSAEEYKFSSDKAYRGKEADITLYVIPPYRGKEGIKLYKNLLENEIYISRYKNAIGERDEYIELEKRRLGREKGKYKERRSLNKIEDAIQLLINQDELKMIQGSHKNREVSKMRTQIANELYKMGYTISEIARIMNKDKAAIFRIVKQ